MRFEYHGEFNHWRFQWISSPHILWSAVVSEHLHETEPDAVVCAVSIAESSMLLVSTMSGFKTNTIIGDLGSVSGSTTISIHLPGTTIWLKVW
jgi:hypothetical protein